MDKKQMKFHLNYFRFHVTLMAGVEGKTSRLTKTSVNGGGIQRSAGIQLPGARGQKGE